MSKIIQPFGRLAHRITIEIDVNQQARCTAENIVWPVGPNLAAPGVGKRPAVMQMDGITLARILSGVAHSTLIQVTQQIAKQFRGNNAEKTEESSTD